jgi:hypothetical protein
LNQQNARVLVLPRPNLGPEPWSEERQTPWPLITVGLMFAALLAGAGRLLFRRHIRRPTAPSYQPSVSTDTPDAQLLSLAEQARETLATRFGPSLRAHTTEEISGDSLVKEALGEEHFCSLIRLLSTADRWKFASPPENGHSEALLEELPRWADWQVTLPNRAQSNR